MNGVEHTGHPLNARPNTAREPSANHAPAGFWVLRTPFGPLDELTSWFARDAMRDDSVGDDARMCAGAAILRPPESHGFAPIILSPTVLQAIWVASPDLAAALERAAEGTAPLTPRAWFALVRYWSRLSSRPTPFGLFAGCTTGTIAEYTAIHLEAQSEYVQCAYIDHGVQWRVAERLADSGALDRILRTNPASYQVAGVLRVISAMTEVDGSGFRLGSIPLTEILSSVLAFMADGRSTEALRAELLRLGASLAEAESYIRELIASQALVSDDVPRVTCDNAWDDFVERVLPRITESKWTDEIAEVRRQMARCQGQLSTECNAEMRRAAARVTTMAGLTSANRVLHVDLYKPAKQVMLSRASCMRLYAGVRALSRLAYDIDAAMGAATELRAFKEKFVARYGDREVPLLEAVDDDFGVGFAGAWSASSDGSEPDTSYSLSRHVETLLLRRVWEARESGANEITISDDDLDALEGSEEAVGLPDNLIVQASFVGTAGSDPAATDPEWVLWNASGPSAVANFGRFCNGDATLCDAVRTQTSREQAESHETLLAEVVHIPAPRAGNVIARPCIREYEIPLLGQSGAPPRQQILPADLTVRVEASVIILRSRTLGRDIIPRVSNAHAGRQHMNLPCYRFLFSLQSQNTVSQLQWFWGSLIALPFLPRVVYGRVVLAPATWRIAASEVRALLGRTGAALDGAVRAFRQLYRLPRRVLLLDGDQALLVDFESRASTLSLADSVGASGLVQFREATFAEQSAVTGPEGSFANEVMIPFNRPPVARAHVITARRLKASRKDLRLPGSDWLFAELYCGAGHGDRVLLQVVRPLVREIAGAPEMRNWFFIRYADPAFHIRLRIQGAPRWLAGEVLPVLRRHVEAAIDAGSLSSMTLCGYDREVERYGGPSGCDLAERIFCLDSTLAMDVVSRTPAQDATRSRFVVAASAAYTLVHSSAWPLEQEHSFVRHLAREFFDEQFAEKPDDGRRLMTESFRQSRQLFQRMLDGDSTLGPLASTSDLIRRNAEAIVPFVAGLHELHSRGQLSATPAHVVASLIHMRVNRILAKGHRRQEAIMYDLIERHVRSLKARQSRHV